MTDCDSESLRGPALYLVDSDLSAVDRALELTAYSERGLAVDLLGSLRGDVAEYLDRRGFERIVSRQLMVIDPTSVSDTSAVHVGRSDQLQAVRSIQQHSFGLSSGDVAALYPPTIFTEVDTELVVVSDKDAVVATATVHHDSGTAGIFGVACDPRRRGSGFGTAASVGAISSAAARSADLCWLQAGDDVAPFYERLGFRPIDTCDVWATAYV